MGIAASSATMIPLEPSLTLLQLIPFDSCAPLCLPACLLQVGTTSVTAGFVKALEARIKASGALGGFSNIDGVVAVSTVFPACLRMAIPCLCRSLLLLFA